MKRILYIQYTNPAGYPPLEHSSTLLANAGWQVLFLGTSAVGVQALRFPPHPNIAVRQLSFPAAGWRQKLHFVWFLLWGLGWGLWWRPRWVYASDPLSCPLALALCVLGFPVIYHEHDSPATRQGPGAVADSGWFRTILRARAAVARRARRCILPNGERVTQFREEIPGTAHAECVWNCPTRDEVMPPRQITGGNILRVKYHGSINPVRFPPAVIHALLQLPPAVTVSAVGYETIGHLGYVRRLRELACDLGVLARVEFVRALPRKEMLHHCHRDDVGLALMPRSSPELNEQHMTGASNKPFDYLACGLALLVSDRPDWRAMFVEPGYGLACDPESADSIAAALRWFLEHPAEMREMGERGRQRILSEWNYESQFRSVLYDICSRGGDPRSSRQGL